MWPARPFSGYNQKAGQTRIEQEAMEVTEGFVGAFCYLCSTEPQNLAFARILTKRGRTRKHSKKESERKGHGWTQVWCSKIDAAPFPTGQKINSQELRARLPVF
jgi:hypothetical protein